MLGTDAAVIFDDDGNALGRAIGAERAVGGNGGREVLGIDLAGIATDRAGAEIVRDIDPFRTSRNGFLADFGISVGKASGGPKLLDVDRYIHQMRVRLFEPALQIFNI